MELKGLRQDSRQGDKEILGVLKCMGAEVEYGEDSIVVKKAELKPIEVDVGQIPDLVPVLAVLGCAVKGKMRIYNAGRLRLKESDRLNAMASELEKLGADIIEYEDSLVINGKGMLHEAKWTATVITGLQWLLRWPPVSRARISLSITMEWLQNPRRCFMRNFPAWEER